VIKATTDPVMELLLELMEDKKARSVSQLVSLLREHVEISENQARDKVINLETQGKIKFFTQPLTLSSKISSYLKTGQASWFWIATIFALLTLVSVFLIPENFQPLSYLRSIVVVIFIAFLPGYTLVKTLFPVEVSIETFEGDFDQIERFALSICMSLVVVPIVGLYLNFTPWGIGLAPMTFFIFGFSMVFSVIALIREHRAKIKTSIL
jgi:hypothetical protein